MTKFYKKPQGVEAIQYLGKNSEEVFQFLDWGKHKIVEEDQSIFILSKGSVASVHPTDWLVRELDGTFTILKNEVFVETYAELK